MDGPEEMVGDDRCLAPDDLSWQQRASCCCPLNIAIKYLQTFHISLAVDQLL